MNYAINQPVDVFDLADYIGEKKIDKALQTLDNLIYQKIPIQKIIKVLHKRFDDFYRCKVAISLDRDIATALSFKLSQLFLVPKYKKQSSNFTEDELQKILELLEELAYNDFKTDELDLWREFRGVLYGIKP